MRSTLSGIMVLAFAALSAADDGRPAPDVNTIVARMVAARQENKARARAYTVKRGYQLMDKQAEPKAEVVASITYLPPNQKQYNIESSTGGMGAKVLRDIVAKEAETSKQPERRELSPENYDFQLIGEETLAGHHCYVLSMTPKRDEKDMIKGQIWVDASTYNVHRVEGNTVKSPSWWIRDLHILMNFAQVDGMWLHTSTHAVADVRFKGKYVVESKDLQYFTVQETASRRRRNPGILAGVAIAP